MKSKVILALLMATVLMLTACGNSTTTSPESSTEQTTADVESANSEEMTDSTNVFQDESTKNR